MIFSENRHPLFGIMLQRVPSCAKVCAMHIRISERVILYALVIVFGIAAGYCSPTGSG
jgi:hypothetical protein